MSEADTFYLKRKHFGEKVIYKPREEDTKDIYILEDKSLLQSNYKIKNPKTITLGNTVEKSSHTISTEKAKIISKTIKHTQGGWPAEIDDPTEHRQVLNWKREKEKKEGFLESVVKLIGYTEDILKQNLRIDVYEDYFSNSTVNNSNNTTHATNNSDDLNYSIKINTVFKDICEYERSISKVCFTTDEHIEQGKVAIAYKLQESSNKVLTIDKNTLPCLIWELNNPNKPCNIIYPTNNSEIITCSFNNKNPNILGTGCSNGNILIYDLKSNNLIVTSKLEYCHSEPVRDFVWLKSKNGTEFVTTSTDGKVIWWDIRDINVPKKAYVCPDSAETKVPLGNDGEFEWVKNKSYKPFMLIDKDQKSSVLGEPDIEKEYGGLKIEYNPEAGASKFLIATEQGKIFSINKKKNDAEFGIRYGFGWGRHLGPIAAMQRNPYVLKSFISVGDWTVRIWFEDSKTPIYVSKYHSAYLTDCCWLPCRTAVFFVVRTDGWILAYDLLYKTDEPIFSQKISDLPITSMSINYKGDKIILGDDGGVAYLLDLNKAFYDTSEFEKRKSDEVNFLTSVFEREVQREKSLGSNKDEKKKNIQTKDVGVSNIKKEEQAIEEKINAINEQYIPLVNNILYKNIRK